MERLIPGLEEVRAVGPDSHVQVGFVGAGRMGAPMIERMLGAGLSVQVYARREEVRRRLQEHGAEVVDGSAEAGRDADVVILCLFSEQQVRDVALGADGVIAAMPEGAALVNHTTCSTKLLDELAAAATPQGVALVDAPVSGSTDEIRRGSLTVLLGGEDDAVRRCRPVLEAYADPLLPTGGVGTATKTKLINNVLFASHMQLAVEAARLAEEIGLSPGALVTALQHCSGGSTVLRYLYERGGPDTHPRDYAVRVSEFMRKDIVSCEEVAEGLSADLGLLGWLARNGPANFFAQ